MATGSTPSSDDIRAQLEAILRSEEFVSARRLQDFLRYIIEKTLRDEQTKIKQFTIAIDVYDRPPSFEPKSDPLIRIEARRLRRALARYYENNADASVLIEIPRGSYVPRFTSNDTSGKDESPKKIEGRFAEETELPVIGVFPFDCKAIEDSKYLADGLAEELVDQLCHFPYLRVMSYSTTSNARRLSSEFQDLCASLGIDIALTGSLQVDNECVRFNCKLHDVRLGEQIWSYKRAAERSISTIQNCEEEILAGIASRIGDTSGVLSRYLLRKIEKRNQRPSTFEAVLKSHYYQQNITQESYDMARFALETAILNDPKNPTLLAFMSELYIDASIFGFADIQDAIVKGCEFASLAVTIDPNCQIAHHSRAYAAFVNRDIDGVMRSAERITEINPHAASMIAVAGFWFCLCGEYEKGMKWFGAGTELNPMYERWLHAAPYFYCLHQKNYDAALEHAREFEMPGFFWGNIMRISALGLLGRTDEASLEYDKLLQLRPDFPTKYRDYLNSFVWDEKLLDRMIAGIETLRTGSTGNRTAIAKAV